MILPEFAKIKIVATSPKRINFIKKILNINNLSKGDEFYVDWFLLKSTTLRRTTLILKCDDCGKEFKKRISSINKNDILHFCGSCFQKGKRHYNFGKKMHKNTKTSLINYHKQHPNPFTLDEVKKKIKSKNPWKKISQKNLGKKRGEETCKRISKGIKKSLKEGTFKISTPTWPKIKSFKGITYQSTYELNFLKFIEKNDLLHKIQRGPILNYINEYNKKTKYYVDYQFKDTNIIFEIKSSYILNLHKENYVLKEKCAIENKYNFNLILDNDFSKLKNIISLYKSSLTTILYSGGFKPITGGHIYLINKYLSCPNVNKVVLFISNKPRGNITAEIAAIIAKYILRDLPVEIVLDKKSYSPILACYRWIQEKERTPGKYALAASSKGDDYKRVKEFSYNYTPERYAKNLPNGVEVTELVLDVDPLTYKNGEPISATRARADLKSGNYESFKENFPALPEGSIEFIWNTLNQSINFLENFPALPDKIIV